MTAYYNEIDLYAAQWLRNLIAAGYIAAGEVDTRSIVDVRPDDLRGFTQCHFFAGIGGWIYAARLAGWPDDRELWTGSCPCQPFSTAGKGEGQADARHLWPELFRLTSACRPDVLMGEQVAAAVGKNWLDGVCTDLEGIGYTCGAVVVPACAVDAPHRRDRLWFVADRASERPPDRHGRSVQRQTLFAGPTQQSERRSGHGYAMADAFGQRLEERKGDAGISGTSPQASPRQDPSNDRQCCGRDCRFSEERCPKCGYVGRPEDSTASLWICAECGERTFFCESCPERSMEFSDSNGRVLRQSSSAPSGFWSTAVAASCRDGKIRRIEPSIQLLADGVPARVGRLRAYGNAIVPQVAAEVIAAFMECTP